MEHDLEKQATIELRRIVLELIAAIGMSHQEIAELMGYKSRTIVSIMCNHQYGETLYPKSALFAFLHAVGVRYDEDVRYVSEIYDIAAKRETTEHPIIQRPTRRNWMQHEPETGPALLSVDQRHMFARLVHSS